MAGNFLTSDLDIFLNESDFAVSAIHTPDGGVAQPAVSVIFLEELREGDQYRGIVEEYIAEIYGKTTALAAVKLNDLVTIAGVDYQVTSDAVPDGTGLSKVPLRRLIPIRI